MPTARIFYSYSSKDEMLRAELETHLSPLRRAELVETWSFRCIQAGVHWEPAVDEALEAADIVLLLVSANFLDSNYCWDVEMKRALERERAGDAVVVPIILRDCVWQNAAFAKLQVLPAGGKAVMSWKPREKAWTGIVTALEAIARRIAPRAVADAVGTSPAPTPSAEPIARATLVTALATGGSRGAACGLLGITGTELRRLMAEHSLSLKKAQFEVEEERRRLREERSRLANALQIGGSFRSACELLGISRDELVTRLRVHELSLLNARAEPISA